MSRHAVFEPQPEHFDEFREVRRAIRTIAPSKRRRTPSAVRYGQIFRNHHASCRAAHWVLKDAAYKSGSLVLWHPGDVNAVNENGSGINWKHTRNGIERCGLAGAV